MMQKTPKSLRLQIGLFGRTNVGKSSFLNLVSNQDVAITSAIPGTTTDTVEKTMELLPVGPVVFLDTAGLDDVSALAPERIKKAHKVFDRADVCVIITEANKWGEYEEKVLHITQAENMPCIVVINKIDLEKSTQEFLEKLKTKTKHILECSTYDKANRDDYINRFKQILLKICPEDFIKPPALLGDLLPKQGVVILIVPIDLEAPKGRIILPQVQAIRDTLDHDQIAIVVKESEYAKTLTLLKTKPDLVVCDSQVVDQMVAETPKDVLCTTFSILLARNKGDLKTMLEGAKTIKNLKPGDKILIAESCSHHAIEDDIGRVKIPKWINQFVGGELKIDISSGRDFPDNLAEYKLVIQCGGCMLTRREILVRINKAKTAGVPITNYGLAISYLKGVLERVTEVF